MNEIDIENLRSLLRLSYPDGLDLEITDLREITAGWETDIYSFTQSYSHRDQVVREEKIIRMYYGTHQGDQARKEYAVLQNAEAAGVSVPRVDLLSVERAGGQNAFIVMEKIQGGTLLSAIQRMGHDEITWVLREMVRSLVGLHRLPWHEILNEPRAGLTEGSGPYGLTNARLDEICRRARRFGLAEFDPYLEWLERRIKRVGRHYLCLNHNDYHPENILLRAGSSDLVIIDWSFADVGDYRLDLAWCLLLTEAMVGPYARSLVLEAYEEFSESRVEDLDFFEVLKFTDRLITIATWLDGRVKIPVKKITPEAIRGGYKVHVLNVYHRLKDLLGYELPIFESL